MLKVDEEVAEQLVDGGAREGSGRECGEAGCALYRSKREAERREQGKGW
jgi:hypothetical protein